MERHPIFSKRIIPRGKVKKARLYLCGLGLYEAYFTDGEKTETDILKSAKIGEEYLTRTAITTISGYSIRRMM